MSAAPGVPSEGELSALPAAELAVLLAEAYRMIGGLTARIGRLERLAGKDSSTSSRPPSSDGPYKKKSGNWSLRERGKRRPGKQPGEPGVTMNLIGDPFEVIDCPPAACRGCGADLAGAPVTAERRHQVTDVEPAPAPKTTEYRAQAKVCARAACTVRGRPGVRRG
jgi:transposase